FSVPDSYSSIGAGRIRTIQRQIEPNLRIIFPDEFSGGSFHGVDLRERSADVDHAVHNNRLGYDAHGAVIIQVPGKPQVTDVLIANLLERAEMLRYVGAAVQEPVVAGGGIGQDARLVHVAGLHGAVRRRAQCDGNSDRGNDKNHAENAPDIHTRPPFECFAELPPQRREIACHNLIGAVFLTAMLGSRPKESQRASSSALFLIWERTSFQRTNTK